MSDAVRVEEFREYDAQQIPALYNSVGWQIYTKEPEKLQRAFSGSLCSYGAYCGSLLAGLIRLAGDGESVVLIQDLLVRPEFRGRGIGRQLVAQAVLRYSYVGRFYVVTDDLPDTVGFYKAVGFVDVKQHGSRAMTRTQF